MRGNRLWRRLDAWAGRTAIAGLSLLPGPRARPPAEPRRILVVKLAALGDTVLLVPALRALRERFPGARIEMVCTAVNAPLAEELGAWIDELHRLEPGRAVRQPSHLLRFAAELRRRRFDVAVDFEQWTHVAAVLLRLAGVPARIGFRTPAPLRHRLYTETRPRRTGSHEAANFLRLLEPLGIRDASPRPELPVRPEVLEEVRSRLAAAGWDGLAPLVVVHPGCGHAHPRAWPLDRYRELCGRLAAEVDPFCVFSGTGAEMGLVRALAADRPDRSWAPERLPVPELVALCSLADLVVSGNTGVMHVAAALGRPQVVAEGPNDPARWGPLNPDAVVVRSSCPGCPCLDFGWEFHRADGFCMEQVPVDEMHAAARALLDRVREDRRAAPGSRERAVLR